MADFRPPRRAPGMLLAWALLDAAIAVYLGLYARSTVSVGLLAAGLVVFIVGALGVGSRPGLSLGAMERSVAALVGIHLALATAIPFREAAPAPPLVIPASALGALAGLAIAIFARRGLGAALLLAIACGVVARIGVVVADIPPTFDVPYIQRAAGDALLHGTNPYHTTVYVQGYPYWPVSAIAAAVGLAAGDARWTNIVADATTALAFVLVARSTGAGTRLGLALAAMFLWSSGGLFLTWQGFPEPLVLALAALSVAILVRMPARSTMAGVAIGLAAVTKQWGVGLLPFLAVRTGDAGRRAFLVATVTAGAIVLPFLLWDAAAFIHGSIVATLEEPGRGFALNVLEPFPGVLPPLIVPFVASAGLGLVLDAAIRLRWSSPIGGWLGGSVALYLVVFAFSGIAFPNYYALALGLLLLTLVLPDEASMDE